MNDLSVKDIEKRLLQRFGSRVGADPAVLVNLGDGGWGVVGTDYASGDYFFIDSTGESYRYAEFEDIESAIAATWGVEDKVTSATKICCTKGTSQQFIDALKTRIAALGGDVSACDTITSDTYLDVDGIMGDPNQQLTSADLKKYWDENKDDDPVLVNYDNYDTWLEDTMQYLQPVTSGSLLSEEDEDSLRQSRNLSTSSDKYVTDSWGKMVALLESEEGYKVDSVNRVRFDKYDKFITLYKDNKEYEAEVTAYHDGTYEIMKYNIHEVGDIEAATNTSGISAKPSVLNTVTEDVITPDDDVTSAQDFDADMDGERYLHNLIGDIQSEVESEVDGLIFNTDDDSLLVTVTYTGKVIEFAVPFEDLSFNFDTMEEDVSYVANTILEEIETNLDDVDSATAVQNYEISEQDAAIEGSVFEFGAEEAAQYGDLIVEQLSGQTVSKRVDLGEQPGGLVYEANRLGIDMWDLLKALEGMCRDGRAQEIDDSTYKVG